MRAMVGTNESVSLHSSIDNRNPSATPFDETASVRHMQEDLLYVVLVLIFLHHELYRRMFETGAAEQSLFPRREA